jgi:autotransporter-associated beta strand protein
MNPKIVIFPGATTSFPLARPALGGLFLAALPHLSHAASITWDTPQPIAAATDISTEGNYFGSWAPYHGNANQFPVNGVTFQGFDTLGISNSGFAGGGSFFGTHSTADANYNTLVTHGTYANGTTANFTLNGNGARPLTVGRQYLVQAWVSDARNLGGFRSQTISGSGAMAFPSDGSGMGSWVIGRFTADASSQQFDITANASAQLNLLQVRDITPTSNTIAYFDGSSAGTWDSNSINAWSLASGGPYSQTWNETIAGRAVFEGTGNPVLVAEALTLRSISFTAAGYVLNGNGPINLIGDSTLDTGTFGATISCPIGGSAGITKIGNSTLVLSAANLWAGPTAINAGVLELNRETNTNFAGSTTFTGGGTLRKSGAGEVEWGVSTAIFALASGSLIEVTGGTLKGGSNANDVWTNNLADLHVATGSTFRGTEANIRVDALTGDGSILSGYPGAGYQEFTFGVDNGTGTFNGILANDASPATFVKTGTGTQTLTGLNTYTGNTIIEQGTLSVTQAYLDNFATVEILADGTLDLDHELNDTVGSLFLAGVQAKAGLWGRPGSIAALGADFETALISGDGLLDVVTGPDPLAAWLQENITDIDPLANATATGDPDGDGLDNLTEFALDGDPLGGTNSGKVVGKLIEILGQPVLTLTLPVRAGATFTTPGSPGNLELVSATIDGLVYRIQGSDATLADWTLDVTESTDPAVIAFQATLPALSSADWEYRTFRTPGSTAGDDKDFIRASITAAP